MNLLSVFSCVSRVKSFNIYLLQAFQSYLDASSYKAFNPENHTGYWKQLALRTSRLGHVMAMVDFHPQQLSQVKCFT